jgi:archaellum component FlaC
VIKLCQEVQNVSGKKLKDFKETLHGQYQGELDTIQSAVNKFAEQFEFIDEDIFNE